MALARFFRDLSTSLPSSMTETGHPNISVFRPSSRVRKYSTATLALLRRTFMSASPS